MTKDLDKPAVEAFATKVKTLRADNHWSQSQLAKKAGLPLGTIKSIEGGEKETGITKAVRLSEAFGVSVDTLLDEARAVLPTPKAEKADKPKVMAIA